MKSYKLNPKVIRATGKNGRILKEDVLNYLKAKEEGREETYTKPQETKQVKEEKIPQMESYKPSGEDQTIKLVGFQKAMTKTMTQANSIPSFLFTEELDVDKLVKLRKEVNSSPKNDHTKITFTPFFIKALSLALNEFPILNSVVNPNIGSDGYIYEYTQKGDHNITIAIDSPDGLVVPNIKKVQNKSVVQIQKDLNVLVERSKNRKLTNEDLTNGTFSCSNIGK